MPVHHRAQRKGLEYKDVPEISVDLYRSVSDAEEEEEAREGGKWALAG